MRVHWAGAPVTVLDKRDTLEARGAILHPEQAARAFRLERASPDPQLAPYVRWHWFIHWDVPEPFTQGVLSKPGANLVSEDYRVALSGIWTKRFDRRLEGRGAVFGTLFRPAGFAAFHDAPMHTLCDRHVDYAETLGVDAAALHRELLDADDNPSRVRMLGELLLRRSPRAYEEMASLNELVAYAEAEPGLTRARDLADHAGATLRTLQRKLRRFVGVGPKSLLRRFRLQDAAAQLESGDVDLAELAYALGYCDQAHFVRDFTAVVGQPPGAYRASLARAESQGAQKPKPKNISQP